MEPKDQLTEPVPSDSDSDRQAAHPEDDTPLEAPPSGAAQQAVEFVDQNQGARMESNKATLGTASRPNLMSILGNMKVAFDLAWSNIQQAAHRGEPVDRSVLEELLLSVHTFFSLGAELVSSTPQNASLRRRMVVQPKGPFALQVRALTDQQLVESVRGILTGIGLTVESAATADAVTTNPPPVDKPDEHLQSTAPSTSPVASRAKLAEDDDEQNWAGTLGS